ncbi:hypothetical protein HDV06_001213 [Boothiomyces sp. JEL0866]|nr:hypothetical protein HDV06_001213 [Boothiomyces sp. JEL0866]
MTYQVGGLKVHQKLILVACFVLYLAVIGICTWQNNKAFNKRQQAGLGAGVPADVNVTNLITSFSPANLQLSLVSTAISTVNYSVVINGKSTDFKDAKDALQQISSTIPILDAHTVTYPFDTYDTVVSVMVKDFKTQQPIPFGYDFSGSIDLWRSTIDVQEISGADGPAVERLFNISLQRTTITIVFSIFLYCTMWVLSSTAFLVTLSIWTRGRKVEPPTIAAVGAILFALPNIRNAQPGAPPIGCNADVLAFFPCMFLVTAAVAMGLINYVFVYKAEKKPDQKPQPAPQLTTYDSYITRPY